MTFLGIVLRFYAVSGGAIVQVLFDDPNPSGLPKELVGDVLAVPISSGDLDVLRALYCADPPGVSIDQIP